MLYQISLIIEGNINRTIVNKISNELIIQNIDNNLILLTNPINICDNDVNDIVEYQNSFILFIKNNYDLIKENGGKNFILKINIFLDNDVSALFLFEKEEYKIIEKYNIKLLVNLNK